MRLAEKGNGFANLLNLILRVRQSAPCSFNQEALIVIIMNARLQRYDALFLRGGIMNVVITV